MVILNLGCDSVLVMRPCVLEKLCFALELVRKVLFLPVVIVESLGYSYEDFDRPAPSALVMISISKAARVRSSVTRIITSFVDIALNI